MKTLQKLTQKEKVIKLKLYVIRVKENRKIYNNISKKYNNQKPCKKKYRNLEKHNISNYMIKQTINLKNSFKMIMINFKKINN